MMLLGSKKMVDDEDWLLSALRDGTAVFQLKDQE